MGPRRAPPHTRGSEAQRRGERDDPGPAPGGVGRPGHRPGGRRHTAPTGLAGERRTAAAPPDERRKRRGQRRRETPGRARARKRGGEAGRAKETNDDTRTVFPSRDVRGDAAAHDAQTGPDLGDGESHRPEPPPPHRREKKSTQAGGYLTARHPTRCGGGSPRETRLPGGRRRRGRKSPQTHLGRRTHRHAADDGRPLSLLPSRGSRNARSLPLAPSRTDPPPRQTRPPPPKEGPPAVTGPDASGDATGDDRPPFSPKAAPERVVTTPQSQNRIPDPEEGRVNPLLPKRGNAAGEGGARRPPHGTQHERRTHATRAARPRSRERQRRGSAGGTARGGHGRWTGGAREPTATQPRSLPARLRAPTEARTHPRGSGGTGVPRHSGVHARGPFVPRHGLHVPGSDTAGTPASRHALLPRVVPPRTRSEEARAAVGDRHKRSGFFPPQRRDAARGTRPKLRASGCQGVLGATPFSSDR